MKLTVPKLPDLASLSRRERLLAAGTAVAIAFVMLDRAVLGPWWQHGKRVRQEVRSLEEALRARRQLLDRKPQIVGELEAYRDYLRPDPSRGSDMASLLREIETLGAKSGILLGEVKPSAGAGTEDYQEYGLDVQYQGSLQQWIHFIYLLEASRWLFDIERATITRQTEGVDLVEGSIRLTSRVLRPQPSPPAAGTGA